MTVAEHLGKVKSNERFLFDHRLAESEFLDWAVTVISYTALHYVDALLASSFGAAYRTTRTIQRQRVLVGMARGPFLRLHPTRADR